MNYRVPSTYSPYAAVPLDLMWFPLTRRHFCFLDCAVQTSDSSVKFSILLLHNLIHRLHPCQTHRADSHRIQRVLTNQ